jgi:hypothetical protein
MLTIDIPINSLTPENQILFNTGGVKHMVIDYADNTLVGYTLTDAVELYNFNDYFHMDNRYNKYAVLPTDEGIRIEITSTRV